MNTRPLEPAELSFTEDGVPFSARYGDVYHSHAGAIGQARHVFLAGNDLPARWRGRERFCIVETGFGLGNNFLATWDAWRGDPQRCERLHFVSVEKHPLRRSDLARVPRDPAVHELARRLVAAWPPLTHNLHRMAFDDGHVQLTLAFGDVGDWLPELVLSMDACFLDGFAPARNPDMWQPRLWKALARLAAPRASAATWSVARDVRAGLASAGFEVQKAPGFEGKSEMTRARYAPRFVPRRAPARAQPAPGERRAAIVGAGLAGCATAWALSLQGWRSTLFDRQPEPAQETSGNAAGLFHGSVNVPDGIHARFNRAAAIETSRLVCSAVARGHLRHGGVTGALRLETRPADVAAMRAALRELSLPTDYVEALDAAQASAACGLALRAPAWHYPGGGWVVPGELARAFIGLAGSAVRFRGGTAVAALRRDECGWQLIDADGEVVDTAPVVVLAGAADALRLLGDPDWPLERVRGQTTALPAVLEGVPRTRIPVAGTGYLLPEADGWVTCGATSQPGDQEPAPRAADHAFNLRQLSRLAGRAVAPTEPLVGRVGWRLVASDRLPLLGAVPDADAMALGNARLDQPRFVPRMYGLYVFTALASRGITWAALGGHAVAALVSGAPSPLEASLLDAVDVARFASRRARRRAS
jgi:tRNA 5-methylaminomethyl-2-thiouridine biosynthesis bifunctional protein